MDRSWSCSTETKLCISKRLGN